MEINKHYLGDQISNSVHVCAAVMLFSPREETVKEETLFEAIVFSAYLHLSFVHSKYPQYYDKVNLEVIKGIVKHLNDSNHLKENMKIDIYKFLEDRFNFIGIELSELKGNHNTIVTKLIHKLYVDPLSDSSKEVDFEKILKDYNLNLPEILFWRIEFTSNYIALNNIISITIPLIIDHFNHYVTSKNLAEKIPNSPPNE